VAYSSDLNGRGSEGDLAEELHSVECECKQICDVLCSRPVSVL
jgi:hypothetical protein